MLAVTIAVATLSCGEVAPITEPRIPEGPRLIPAQDSAVLSVGDTLRLQISRFLTPTGSIVAIEPSTVEVRPAHLATAMIGSGGTEIVGVSSGVGSLVLWSAGDSVVVPVRVGPASKRITVLEGAQTDVVSIGDDFSISFRRIELTGDPAPVSISSHATGAQDAQQLRLEMSSPTTSSVEAILGVRVPSADAAAASELIVTRTSSDDVARTLVVAPDSVSPHSGIAWSTVMLAPGWSLTLRLRDDAATCHRSGAILLSPAANPSLERMPVVILADYDRGTLPCDVAAASSRAGQVAAALAASPALAARTEVWTLALPQAGRLERSWGSIRARVLPILAGRRGILVAQGATALAAADVLADSDLTGTSLVGVNPMFDGTPLAARRWADVESDAPVACREAARQAGLTPRTYLLPAGGGDVGLAPSNPEFARLRALLEASPGRVWVLGSSGLRSDGPAMTQARSCALRALAASATMLDEFASLPSGLSAVTVRTVAPTDAVAALGEETIVARIVEIAEHVLLGARGTVVAVPTDTLLAGVVAPSPTRVRFRSPTFGPAANVPVSVVGGDSRPRPNRTDSLGITTFRWQPTSTQGWLGEVHTQEYRVLTSTGLHNEGVTVRQHVRIGPPYRFRDCNFGGTTGWYYTWRYRMLKAGSELLMCMFTVHAGNNYVFGPHIRLEPLTAGPELLRPRVQTKIGTWEETTPLWRVGPVAGVQAVRAFVEEFPHVATGSEVLVFAEDDTSSALRYPWYCERSPDGACVTLDIRTSFDGANGSEVRLRLRHEGGFSGAAAGAGRPFSDLVLWAYRDIALNDPNLLEGEVNQTTLQLRLDSGATVIRGHADSLTARIISSNTATSLVRWRIAPDFLVVGCGDPASIATSLPVVSTCAAGASVVLTFRSRATIRARDVEAEWTILRPGGFSYLCKPERFLNVPCDFSPPGWPGIPDIPPDSTWGIPEASPTLRQVGPTGTRKYTLVDSVTTRTLQSRLPR